MKVQLTHEEAVILLTIHLADKTDRPIEHVEIIAEKPVREIHAVTYTSEMVQELWSDFMAPTNVRPNLAPVKIALIKLFMGLHYKLTGTQCGLVTAKNFIESHKTF
jgi:hypothetical protein